MMVSGLLIGIESLEILWMNSIRRKDQALVGVKVLVLGESVNL